MSGVFIGICLEPSFDMLVWSVSVWTVVFLWFNLTFWWWLKCDVSSCSKGTESHHPKARYTTFTFAHSFVLGHRYRHCMAVNGSQELSVDSTEWLLYLAAKEFVFHHTLLQLSLCRSMLLKTRLRGLWVQILHRTGNSPSSKDEGWRIRDKDEGHWKI